MGMEGDKGGGRLIEVVDDVGFAPAGSRRFAEGKTGSKREAEPRDLSTVTIRGVSLPIEY